MILHLSLSRYKNFVRPTTTPLFLSKITLLIISLRKGRKSTLPKDSSDLIISVCIGIYDIMEDKS